MQPFRGVQLVFRDFQKLLGTAGSGQPGGPGHRGIHDVAVGGLAFALGQGGNGIRQPVAQGVDVFGFYQEGAGFDFDAGRLSRDIGDRESLDAVLEARGADPVDWPAWRAIDAAERRQGRQLERPRVKFVSVEELLSAGRP